MGWGDAIGDAASGVAEGAKKAGGKVKKTVDETGDKVDDTVDKTADKVDDTVDKTVGKVDDTVDKTVDKVDDTVDKTTDKAKGTIGETKDKAESAFNETTDEITDTVSSVVGDAQEIKEDTSEDVDQKVDDVSENLRGKIEDAVGGVKNKADDVTDDVGNEVGIIANNVEDKAGDVTDGVSDKVDGVTDSAGNAVDDVQKGADDALRDATGGDIGVSSDWTSMEDSGGIQGTADGIGQEVKEEGREFRRKQSEEGEQFGDFDWSVGGVDLEQKAEDLQAGAQKRGLDAANSMGPSLGGVVLRETGHDALGRKYEDVVGGFAEGIVTRTASNVGGTPKAGMEAVETTAFTLTNPKETAETIPGALSASAVSTAEDFRENPAQAAGGVFGGIALGMGAGRAGLGMGRRVTRSRSSSGSRSGSGQSGGSSPTSGKPRLLTSDRNRGQLIIGRRDRDREGGSSQSDPTGSSSRDGGDSGLLPDNIDEMLEGMENAHSRRDANQRAERNIIDKHLEAGKRQERGDEPRTVTRDREPDTLTRDREPKTVSREPKTSEPTGSGFSQTLDTSVDLSPREKQLAAKIGRQTPSGDLRDLDATRRQTPDTDLRIQMDTASEGSTPAIPGLVGAGAGSDPIQEMEDLRDESESKSTDGSDVEFGDGDLFGVFMPGAQDGGRDWDLPETPGSEIVPPGIGIGSRGDSDSRGDTDTEPDTGQQPDSDSGTRIGTRPDSDSGTRIGTQPDSDTDTRTDTRTGIGPVTDTVPNPPTTDTPPERPPSDPPGLTPPPGRTPPPRDNGGGGGGRGDDGDGWRRIRTPDLDLPGRDDDDKDESWFESAGEGYTVDFVNPLSGETLETDPDDGSDSGIPGLGGML
ncbi:hypothetical protein Htur_5272 (plasmid) [Haloterrigena turkmenica DSM 5511]|uniref:Uncharacterized protein n=1 Tax=Haloterrigena turkmenica (strain ATCC 51198 / DSM 5511 / JCM 9101 / NCIMB 13204 / VKM B-1734 / 4k) TaxID=543526 RepID=D2S3Q3_HALTV|nr:hypothetical protein [Haloterrigena turkmenica]ADB64000.1 hypothetical protein Htur_5272 [Haloterrigena turkmenica DSM 5511]